ncbi:MAG: 16S rRNA (cytosine(1402)-N(4))-methyltransferase RsmH [Patescibacteria group bacterium]
MHVPVLLSEVIKYLNPKPNRNYIDCTLGGTGHARVILERIKPEGKLLGIDLNEKSLTLAKRNLEKFKKRIIFHQGNFSNLKKIVYEYKFNSISGILFDLGLSSYLLNESRYGFSFQVNGPLLMRFDGRSDDLTAEKVVNSYLEKNLAKILWQYGEERYAKKIAKKIVSERKKKAIKTTFDLVKVILETVPASYKKKKIHPATRTFQALRIEVNCELENLKKAIEQAKELLEPRGRIVCISYHSLEDKIVKKFFLQESKDCLCPKEFPVCRCGHKARLKIITKKPIVPSLDEIKQNPRSRSAKMRTAEKI